MKRWTLTVGRWKVQSSVHVTWTCWGIGVGFYFWSWRNLYPWLQFSVWVGPFSADIDLTRPPDTEL